MSTSTISIKELRLNLAKYMNALEKGESFVVLKHAKPVFRLTPVEDERWEAVIDFTKIKPSGVDIDDVLTRISDLKHDRPA